MAFCGSLFVKGILLSGINALQILEYFYLHKIDDIE